MTPRFRVITLGDPKDDGVFAAVDPEKENKLPRRLKGLEAVAEALIRSGADLICLPTGPILAELETYLKERDGDGSGPKLLTVQGEEEAIHIAFGASAAKGMPVTACEGNGFQRMQEGLGYLAVAELPAVITVVMTGGPGLGTVFPSQHLYRQVVSGPGLPLPVLAPGTVQEAAEMAGQAMATAREKKTPVILLLDAAQARFTGKVNFDSFADGASMSTRASDDTPIRVVTSFPDPADLQSRTDQIVRKVQEPAIGRSIEISGSDRPDILLIGFGTAGMAAAAAVPLLKDDGHSATVLRPLMLSPFPGEEIAQKAANADSVIVVEMNTGQLFEDVIRHTGTDGVRSLTLPGGQLPQPKELAKLVLETLGKDGADG